MVLVSLVFSETCQTRVIFVTGSLGFMCLETGRSVKQSVAVLAQQISLLKLVGTRVETAGLADATQTGVMGGVVRVEGSVTLVTVIGTAEESCEGPTAVIMVFGLDQDQDVIFICFYGAGVDRRFHHITEYFELVRWGQG